MTSLNVCAQGRPNGMRKVVSISEVCGFYEGEIQLHEIFKYRKEDGYSATGIIPCCIADLHLATAEMSMFVPSR